MKLIKSIASVSSVTFLSRVFGLIRDWLFARQFGTDGTLDAFLIAFKVPNFFRRLFADGAFSQVFVPVLVSTKKESDPKITHALVAGVSARLFTVVFIFCAIGIIFAPIYLHLFAPGYITDALQSSLTIQLLRITFPYLFFVTIVAFLTALLNSSGRFIVGSFAPVLLNISLILATLFLSPLFNIPIIALALGVFIGGVLQMIMLFISAYRHQLLVYPSFRVSFEAKVKINKIWKMLLPALLSVSVIQINLLVDMALASLLPSGSISWLYYSQRLMELPNGLFIVAVSVVILPSFAALIANQDLVNFQKSLDNSLLLACFITLPCALGLYFLAFPIVSMLLEQGAFVGQDSRNTAEALMVYAFALPAFILVKICLSIFFANNDTKTPLKISVVSVIVNISLSLLLIKSMAHVGLALATTVSVWVNGFLLYITLCQQKRIQPLQESRQFINILLASILIAFLLFFVEHYSMLYWFDLTKWSQIGLVMAIIIVVFITYVVACFLFRVDFKRWLHWNVDINKN